MSERERERAAPPAIAESCAAAVAALAAIAATPAGELVILGLAAAVGAFSGRLERSGPRVAATIAGILVADDLGARIALALVPWQAELLFRRRTLSRDALLVAISAAFTLALVAAARPPFSVAFALLEAAAAIVSLAVVSLRAAAARERTPRADDGRLPLPLPLVRVASATLRFAASAFAVAVLLFVLLPRRPEATIGPEEDALSAFDAERSARGERRGRNRRGGSPLPGSGTRLDPRRPIRLPDPATVAFSVRLVLDGEPLSRVAAADGPLFRECALELFDGDVWAHDESALALVTDEDDGRNDGYLTLGEREPGDGFLEQSYEVLGLSDRYIVCWPPLSLRAERALTDATALLVQPARTPVTGRYTAVSSSRMRPDPARIEAARKAEDAPPESLATPRVDPRIAALAASLGADGARAGAFCRRVEEFVRSAAAYRLENRARIPRSADPIADLLFARRASHCETFAAAMALLCRTGGVPTRIAVGYRGAERVRDDGSFVVFERSRHAWVEAALEGLGWVSFDPTPSAPEASRAGAPTSPREAAPASFADRALAYWENLDWPAQREALGAIASRLVSSPLATATVLLALAALVLVRAVVATALIRRAAWRAAHVSTKAEFDLVRALARLRQRVAAGLATTPRELLVLAKALPAESRAAAAEIVRAHEGARYAGRAPEFAALESAIAALESERRACR